MVCPVTSFVLRRQYRSKCCSVFPPNWPAGNGGYFRLLMAQGYHCRLVYCCIGHLTSESFWARTIPSQTSTISHLPNGQNCVFFLPPVLIQNPIYIYFHEREQTLLSGCTLFPYSGTSRLDSVLWLITTLIYESTGVTTIPIMHASPSTFTTWHKDSIPGVTVSPVTGNLALTDISTGSNVHTLSRESVAS